MECFYDKNGQDYRSDRLIVDQRLVLAFKFAINNGFFELVKRLWLF